MTFELFLLLRFFLKKNKQNKAKQGLKIKCTAPNQGAAQSVTCAWAHANGTMLLLYDSLVFYFENITRKFC